MMQFLGDLFERCLHFIEAFDLDDAPSGFDSKPCNPVFRVIPENVQDVTVVPLT